MSISVIAPSPAEVWLRAYIQYIAIGHSANAAAMCADIAVDKFEDWKYRYETPKKVK